MNTLFNVNGLQFWDSKEIRLRKRFEEYFASEIETNLRNANQSWQFFQCEAPLLTPRKLLNQNYTASDVWDQESVSETTEKLTLRPETTPGSYVYAEYLMSHQMAKPPYVVWQSGKSFRREDEQPSKHCRFKEFYQQEFQCIYSADTLNDYQEVMLEPVRKMLGEMIGLPTRIVESDRLPSYSLRTMDVEVDNGDKWMEVCSISKRTDLPFKASFTNPKNGNKVEKDCLVLEIAIGLDRVVYNFLERSKNI